MYRFSTLQSFISSLKLRKDCEEEKESFQDLKKGSQKHDYENTFFLYLSIIYFYHMVKTSPYMILLISLFFFSISSFVLQEQTASKPAAVFAQSTSHPSLGFSNRTGPSVFLDQVSSFINFINSASSYFHDDTKARLDYISDQMNKTYGRSDIGFTVLQEGNDVYNDWAITTYTNVYASLAAGVDKVFPTKSYMFLKEPDHSGRVFFSEISQKGSGINQVLQAAINSIILSVETSNVCKCEAGSARAISDKISLGLDKRDDWNVICSRANIYLNAYVRHDRYIYTKPKNCYYGIYEV